MKMNDILEKLKNLPNDISIVIAVSGGPDSMALLNLLNVIKKEKNIKIICAHVNHNLRKESKAEAKMVKDYCTQKNIIYEYMEIKEYKGNTENYAREKRYEFFENLLKKYNSKYLFTAHHGDDLIETVIMRLIRSSSLKGYSAFSEITEKKDYKIYRPLITKTKEEIFNYVKNNNLPYAIDKTNDSDFLTRNRIWLDRTEGIGVITKKQAISWGLTGINLRASGGNFDLRRDNPYLVYNRLNFDVPVGTVGDCYERYLLRILEMRESVNILRQCTKLVPNGPINIEDSKIILPPKKRAMTRMEDLIHHFMLATEGITAPPGEVYFGAENPKGELGFYIYSKGGGTPYRLKIRPPSFVSISVMPLLLKGAMISDVPAVIGSLDIVMGECDR